MVNEIKVKAYWSKEVGNFLTSEGKSLKEFAPELCKNANDRMSFSEWAWTLLEKIRSVAEDATGAYKIAFSSTGPVREILNDILLYKPWSEKDVDELYEKSKKLHEDCGTPMDTYGKLIGSLGHFEVHLNDDLPENMILVGNDGAVYIK